MKTRMEEFSTARFATHPDGRIAARIDGGRARPWIAPVAKSGFPLWNSDAEMIEYGFVPLSESLPSTATLVEHFPDGRITGGGGVAVRCRCGCEFWADSREVDGPISDENNTWRVAERRYAEHVLSATPTPTTDEGEVCVRGDWFKASELPEVLGRVMEARNEAQREAKRHYLRAQQAEQERDEAIREAQELGGALDNVKPMDGAAPLTAREHLDAAWSAAHVPADGIIPEGAACIEREVSGDFNLYPHGWTHHGRSANAVYNFERRLLDVPTPKRPEGAEALEAAFRERYPDAPAVMIGTLADTAAALRVRVTEDGAS